MSVSSSLSKAYKALATIPTYTSARFLPSTSKHILNVAVELSQRDLERKAKRPFMSSMTIQVNPLAKGSERATLLSKSTPMETLGVAMSSTSPDGSMTIQLKSGWDDVEEGKRRYVEVWKKGRLIHSIPVTDLHADFYTDDIFGSLTWSKDITKVLYVAGEKSTKDPRKKFDFSGDWGEKYTGKSAPRVFLLDIPGCKVQEVPTPNHVSLGQLSFLPHGRGFVATAYERYPRVYGIVACPNRRARIARYGLDGVPLEEDHGSPLSPQKASARSARIHPTKEDLIYYLRNPSGGPHAMCSELVEVREDGTERILVPIISSPGPEDFPGLFVDMLPRCPWVITPDTLPESEGGGEYLVLTSTWRSRKTILVVDPRTGELKDSTLNKSGDSWSALAAHGPHILAVQSAPNQLPRLMLGTWLGKKKGVEWDVLEEVDADYVSQTSLSHLAWRVDSYPERHSALETLLLQPSWGPEEQEKSQVGGEKSPLIVYPHGGPHSCFVSEFSIYPAALVSLGFSVLLVNYTGSTGFGQKAITDLIGKIGMLEVEDTQYVAEKILEEGKVDKERTCLTGGSHGGFTAAHLLGKYPDFYKACVMRNPVIDVPAMVSNTDIPDWCFEEAGFPYQLGKPQSSVTPESFKSLYDMSPASVADRGLGWVYGQRAKFDNEDQGISRYACKMYPENGHSLDGMEAEAEGFVDLSSWFVRWVGKKAE